MSVVVVVTAFPLPATSLTSSSEQDEAGWHCPDVSRSAASKHQATATRTASNAGAQGNHEAELVPECSRRYGSGMRRLPSEQRGDDVADVAWLQLAGGIAYR